MHNSKLQTRNLFSNGGDVTIGTSLEKLIAVLSGTSSTPRLDAEVLVMHACGIGRSELITHQETPLTGGQLNKLEDLLARRKQGEPVAYIIGAREFWSMELNVTPATLIPRPETELLVEKALEHIPRDAEWTLADLGTGSGALALAIVKERPRCRVIAIDNSPAALEVAKSNAKKFNLANVEFREGDWFAPLIGASFDMIVSNPPYIRAGDPHLTQGDVRFEPATALVSGADGLDAIHQIASQAQQYLKPGGWLLLEHGLDQANAIHVLLQHTSWHRITSYRDLAGHQRVTESAAL